MVVSFWSSTQRAIGVLKDTCTGEEDVPLSLGKGVVEYLQELRERLGDAERYASEHTDKRQTQYTTRYNHRSQDKTFNVGEQVFILVPNSTSSTTFRRWQ